MPAPISNDGIFDGAIFDPRDYRSTNEIVEFEHEGPLLGLVRKKNDHFIAEFLVKRPLSWSTMVGWSWEEARVPVICCTLSEALAFVRQFARDDNGA